MNIALDWLSVSVRTPKDKDIGVIALAQNIVDLMYLDSFYKRAVLVGSSKYYASVYRIDDISFKLARDVEGASHKQGIMIEMTSNGLSKYIHYLTSIGVTLEAVLRDLRSCTVVGYTVNFPRLDICMDDICKEGERPLLRMDKIYNAWAEHLFCSRARAVDRTEKLDYRSDDTNLIKDGKVCDKKKQDKIGRTIYFGSRKSSVCVRFYDKKIEQQQKGREVPKDVKHWVRCEYEFHQERACAVVAMLIENEWSEFVQQFARCVLGHLRFINSDDSNRSRCSTCSWWVKFLDNVCHAEKFTIPPKQAQQGDKTIKWLEKSVFPSLWAYITTIGAEQLLNDVVEQGREKVGYKQLQFIADYIDCNEHNDNLSEFYHLVMWAAMSCKPMHEVICELNRDFEAIQRCKLERSERFKTTVGIVKYILRLGG